MANVTKPSVWSLTLVGGEMMGNPDAQAIHDADGAFARLLQGRLDEAEAGIGAAKARMAFSPYILDPWLAWIAAAAGRPEEGRKLLAELGCPSLDWIPHTYGRLFCFASAAAAAALLGDADTAAEVYPQLLPFAEQWVSGQVSAPGPVAFFLGQAAATLGRLEEAGAHYAHAVDLAVGTGARGQLVRTHLGWAEVLLARGDAGAAQDQLDAAVTLAHELDAPNLVSESSLRPNERSL